MELDKPKNRYANVIAYDHSLVSLDQLPGVHCSDYMNANYLDG
nr:receptor type tyrosine protein phosphatase [Hymenolepis microstoma]